MGGSSIAALITIISTPILTHYFTPDAFGIFAVFSSITGIISIIACMRYELAIMLPKSDDDAINIFALCLLIAFFISVFLLPIFWFFQSEIISLFNLPDLGSYILLIPFMILVNGFFTALYNWHTRTQNFKLLAGARVTNAVMTNGSQLASAFMGFLTAGGLIIGTILGTFSSTLVLFVQMWRTDKAALKSSVRWNAIILGLKRYRNFPIYDSFSAFINNLSWQLPVLMLAAFFSPAIVGFYSLGLMVLFFPMNLIGGALSQNFLQKAAEVKDQGTLGHLVEQVFEILVIVGLYPIFVLTLVGANIVMVIFGPNWGEAGVYLQILSIWAFVWFSRHRLQRDAAQPTGATVPSDTVARFWLNVAIAFVPAAGVGFLLHDWIKDRLFNPVTVAATLIVGGVILLLIERRDHSTGTSSIYDVTPKQALGIGLAQILALIPGASRSATTIMGGLLSGLDRPTATAFSFYLAIPTLGLATVFDLLTSLDQITGGDALNLLVGTVVSFLVALAAIGWLLRYIARNDFKIFGYYRIIFGMVVLAWFWLVR